MACGHSDITAAAGFLGLYNQKCYISMGPILNGYGVTGVFFKA